MRPPGLDPLSVQAKLVLAERLLDDLDGIGDLDPARLEADRLLRHAVERILTQVVDLAVAVNGHLASARLGTGPSSYRDSFRLAARAGALPAELADRLLPSVGMRNVLTHEYATVDLEFVARAARTARADYRAYVTAVARWLRAEAPDPEHPGPGRSA